MPNAPGRKCSKCRGIVRKGKCDKCSQQSQASYDQSDSRGDRNALYGADWRKARDYHIREVEPFCVPCKRQGRLAWRKLEVHHIRSFRGVNDPLRLDQRNMETICVDCHKALAGSGDGKSEPRR